MTTAIDPLNDFMMSELQRLRREWVSLAITAPPLPAYTWEDLAEVLLDCTETPAQELLLRGALSALVKNARSKPQAVLLREVLTLAASASAQNLALLLAPDEGPAP